LFHEANASHSTDRTDVRSGYSTIVVTDEQGSKEDQDLRQPQTVPETLSYLKELEGMPLTYYSLMDPAAYPVFLKFVVYKMQMERDMRSSRTCLLQQESTTHRVLCLTPCTYIEGTVPLWRVLARETWDVFSNVPSAGHTYVSHAFRAFLDTPNGLDGVGSP
jgi:hypothetical protein